MHGVTEGQKVSTLIGMHAAIYIMPHHTNVSLSYYRLLTGYSLILGGDNAQYSWKKSPF